MRAGRRAPAVGSGPGRPPVDGRGRRRGGLSGLVSAGAHAAVLVLVARWAEHHQGPGTSVKEAPGPVAVEILPASPGSASAAAGEEAPLVVTLLPDSPPEASTGAAVAPRTAVRAPETAQEAPDRGPPRLAALERPSPGRSASEASGAVAGAGTGRPGPEPAPGGGPAGGGGLMRMRYPTLRLPRFEPSLDGPVGPPRSEPRVSGKLDHAPGGRGVIHDRVTTVSVERDGTAHFHDKDDVDIHWQLPIPSLDVEEIRHQVGKELSDWYADPEAGKRYGPTAALPEHLRAAPGACDGWGNVFCDDPLAPGVEKRDSSRQRGTVAGGNMDLTAYLMRKFHVGDPYGARKRALLEETFDERAAQGGAYRVEQLDRAAELVRRNVERLWATERDPIARRATLFELWDECAEGPGPLGEAGQRARTFVIGWIRAHLPRGSAGAYTPAELAELARHKSSHQPFVPYDDAAAADR